MILKYLLEFYLFIYISVFLHELAHFIVAKAIKLDNVFLCIGFRNFLGVRTKNFFISPIAINGYVEFDDYSLVNLSKAKKFLFWFSGAMINLIFTILSIIFNFRLLFFVNCCMLLGSLLPLKFLKSDAYNYILSNKNEEN